ncbi:MAG TPA: hypothetical protein VGN37_14415 [Actinocatenispora sp.]
METDDAPIGPDEAASALRQADAASALARAVPPWWYFVSLAVLIAVTPVVELAPDPPLGVVVLLGGIVVWAGLFGLVLGAFIRRIGLLPRLTHLDRRYVLPPAVIAAVIMAAGVTVHIVSGALWPSFAASGLVGVELLVVGGLLRRVARA